MLLELALATARSETVSPLKSPTATERGRVPAPKLVAGVPNKPVPLPKRIETLLEKMLCTAISKNVSMLKSPTATELWARSYSKVSCCTKQACTST